MVGFFFLHCAMFIGFQFNPRYYFFVHTWLMCSINKKVKQKPHRQSTIASAVVCWIRLAMSHHKESSSLRSSSLHIAWVCFSRISKRPFPILRIKNNSSINSHPHFERELLFYQTVFVSTWNFIFRSYFVRDISVVGVDEVTNSVHLSVCDSISGGGGAEFSCVFPFFFCHSLCLPCALSVRFVTWVMWETWYVCVDCRMDRTHTSPFRFNMVFVFFYYFHRNGSFLASVCLLTAIVLCL